ncbi:MAG: mannosyltransferase, partial [Bacteroidota bacterium]
MIQVWKYHKVPLLFILLSILFYVSFAYDLQRDDIPKLLALYFGLCVSAYVIIKQSGFNFRLLVIASVIFRLVFILATPNLSQDFYRFIWDGRMILEGFNPYLYTPDSLINAGELPVAQAQDLYNGMGSLSSSHFTNYPPVNQLCFFIAGVFSSKSTLGAAVVLRILIIMADMGTLYFGKKLLERLKIPSTTIFWYILNPFIIIELTGNLHFEGVMIFFLIWSLYLLHSGKWCWAAVLIAVSISVKLIPLMLLPLFFGWFIHRNAKQPLGKRLLNLVTFYSIIGASTLLLFLPFFSMEFINNYSKTVGLWFNSFEFNASFYYLARQIGYWITGYNEIAIIGKILPAISVLFILGFTFFRKNNSLEQLMTSMV